MDEALMKKYLDEMREMQKRASAPQSPLLDGKGGLIVNVTSLDKLYPVKSALVTVFTGSLENMTEIAKDNTDESGATQRFLLDTPPKSSSLSPEAPAPSFASYNTLVQADGFADAVNTDVRVFSGITSVQGVDMVLLAADGEDTSLRLAEAPSQYML